MVSKQGNRRQRILAVMMVVLLASGAGLAKAQAPVSRFDLSANYVATVANAMPGNCGCFVMSGGGVEGAFHLSRAVAIVGDVSAVHTGNVNGTGTSLGLATFLGGVRYSYRNHTRLLPYAQARLGQVHGFDSVFPGSTSTSANGFAYDFGGGVEYGYSKRLSFRLIEASFLRTNLPNNVNGTQNNLRLGAGIILHLR